MNNYLTLNGGVIGTPTPKLRQRSNSDWTDLSEGLSSTSSATAFLKPGITQPPSSSRGTASPRPSAPFWGGVGATTPTLQRGRRITRPADTDKHLAVCSITYGAHGERRTAWVRLAFAFVRDERLGKIWCHASVFASMGTSQSCPRWVRCYMTRDDDQ